jgi:hypothetical protein
LTPFTVGNLCTGSSWEVLDTQRLATYIAAVAVGQSRHVERVMAGTQFGSPATQASTLAGAVALLTVVGNDPSHRDGWIFQVMSWLAAHKATPGGLIRAPHMQLAHKGFDGLQLELTADANKVTAAVIFEDKATVHPRDTIREEVWTEFSNLETGARDHLLTAEVIALLQTRAGVDPDAAVRNVLWKAVRSYRVSVTISASHSDDAGRHRLFHGYDTVATGDLGRRCGNVLELQQLRLWMQQLADSAIGSAQLMVPTHV